MRLVDRVALPLPNDLALPFKGQNGFTLVDADVFERFADMDLCLVNGYAALRGEGKSVDYLHRRIMAPPDGMVVDHVNGDKLDNRRENLRLATPSQNRMNAHKHERNSLGGAPTSAYRGVLWRRRDRRWEARIGAGGKQVKLGYFRDEIEAARAYDAAARKHFGEFARLNFAKGDEQSALRDVA